LCNKIIARIKNYFKLHTAATSTMTGIGQVPILCVTCKYLQLLDYMFEGFSKLIAKQNI